MAVRERLVFRLALAVLRAGDLVGRVGAWLQQIAREWLGWVAQRLAIQRKDVPPPAPAVMTDQPADEPPLDPVLLATWLWGESNVRPDSVDESLAFVRPFNLQPASRLLHLGAGLGGMSVAIAKASGSRVCGFERCPDLIARSRPVVAAGKGVEVRLLDPMSPSPDGPRWDHVYARFGFDLAAPPEHLLMRCRNALRPAGHVAVIDYALGSLAPSGLTGWSELPDLGVPASLDAWRKGFAAAGLDLRIEEDISATHRLRILAGWSGLMAGGRLAGFKRQQLGAVADAAERWLREAALIDSGALKVIRFYAIAPA